MFAVNPSVAAFAGAVYKRAAETSVAHSLYTRAVEEGSGGSGSSGSPDKEQLIVTVLFIINFVVFFPGVLLLTYTFQQILPTLASVEDEKPPTYEPVALDEAEEASNRPDGNKKPAGSGRAAFVPPEDKPITSGFRATFGLLRANFGFRMIAHGLGCIVAHDFAGALLFSMFSAFLPSTLAVVAFLPASLVLCQLTTAWVHIVMTPPSARPFWRRLPPFGRTFEAVVRPTALYWLARQAAHLLPFLLGKALGLGLADNGAGGVRVTGSAWKMAVAGLAALALSAALVVPAHVVLVRVQASLLPEAESPILPFDRSFGGVLVPAVAGGRGYATVTEAWRTFTPEAWRRLVLLYVKIFLATVAAVVGFSAFVGAQFLVISLFA